MVDYNTETLSRLKEVIIPHLKNKGDGKKTLEQKTWEILTINKSVHTLVSEIKGHIQVKNKNEVDCLILWLKEGEEKIYAYQDKLARKAVGKEILDSKYRNQVVYLDFIKIYKLKSLLDIRYEKVKK